MTASRDLATHEHSIALRDAEGRVKHTKGIGTCYLKIWLQRVTTPDSGGETVEDLDPYIWSATGNPCYAPGATDDVVNGDEIALLHPSVIASGKHPNTVRYLVKQLRIPFNAARLEPLRAAVAAIPDIGQHR